LKTKILKTKWLIFIIIILLSIIGFALFSFAVTEEIGNIGIIPLPKLNENRQSFNYILSPGDEITDFIIVANKSERKKTVIVYASDFVNTKEGGASFKNFYDKQSDVGTWITLETSKFPLNALKGKIIKFNIKVPDNAEIKTYKAGIVAQDLTNLDNEIGLRVAKEITINITNNKNDSEYKNYQEQNPAMFFEKTLPDMKTIYIIGAIIITLTIIFIYLIKIRYKKHRKHNKRKKRD
jgi:hypothetical protein